MDVNFSGATETTLTGFNDWLALDLQQIGARRNARGLSGDIASGDIASGDIASGVIDQLDVDFETFNSLVDAPGNLTATVGRQSITRNWSGPASGQIRQFAIYRAVGAISPSNLPTLIGTRSGTPPSTSFVDNNVKNNVTYTYFVSALNPAGVQSAASNIVAVTK